jgi:di/tricarboxylate transporter
MIGTPPNILVSEALRENGLEPFSLFDFTPLGMVVMIVGIAFVTLAGRRMLPRRSVAAETSAEQRDFQDQYDLKERLFQIKIPPTSALVGKTLAQSHLGSGLGLNVVGITRNNVTRLAPEISAVIKANDQLIVEGFLDRIEEMNHWGQLLTEAHEIGPEVLYQHGMQVARLALSSNSDYLNLTLPQMEFRNRFGLNVFSMDDNSGRICSNLRRKRLTVDTVLTVQGPAEKITQLAADDQFQTPEIVTLENLSQYFSMEQRLHHLRVSENSGLIGLTLSQSRLGDALDVQLLYLVRKDGTALVPHSDIRFEAHDRLIVTGAADMISIFLLKGLEGEFIHEDNHTVDPKMLLDDQVGLVEVTLSPHSVLSGQSLHQMNFREKYGLSVLAIWRKGRAHRSNLRDMAVQFGDALLLYGPWKKLNLLGTEPDFLVLTETAQEVPNEEKAPVALTVMAAVLIPVMFGWLPIYIAVVIGAAVMILTKCLTMEEAYRYIEWKAVFLIAGMLPLGTALDKSGAARLLAEQMVAVLGPLGPHAVLFGLLVITFAATSIIPTAALVVLMVPIALKASTGLGISPHTLMMGIAMGASSSFTSPISHPANVLVMGPGGYRFVDYIKVGVPLTLVILVVLMVVLPILWPFA